MLNVKSEVNMCISAFDTFLRFMFMVGMILDLRTPMMTTLFYFVLFCFVECGKGAGQAKNCS